LNGKEEESNVSKNHQKNKNVKNFDKKIPNQPIVVNKQYCS